MDNQWAEQYEETAKKLAEASDQSSLSLAFPAPLRLMNRAADDIRTLIDGLKQYEAKEALRFAPASSPKYNSSEEIKLSDLPDYVAIPLESYPKGIGPGGFDPHTMYIHALALQRSYVHETPMKSWMILFFLDNLDWERVRKLYQIGWETPTANEGGNETPTANEGGNNVST